MRSLHRRSRHALTPLALAAVCLFTLAGPAAAQAQRVVLPQGPGVIRGTAGFDTVNNTMTVKNSNGAIINWKSFSIGGGGTVDFQQANAASQVLNRVVGGDPSRILGSLTSNGKVWLINPQGVLFGEGARVDVAGLVASTLNIGNDDWAAGRYTLTNTLSGDDVAPAVVNEGRLSALGGRIALIAGHGGVTNNGVIDAPGGQVLLAAGTSVDLVDSAAPNIKLRVGTVANFGEVMARGGRIDAQAAIVNQLGYMSADALATGNGGQIVLRASQRVVHGAESVTTADGAWYSDDESGGNRSGDGGRIVVHGDGQALVRGRLGARSGDLAGNGGQIETSGAQLDVRARVDAGSDNGRAGSWLAQGANVFIVNAGAATTGAAASTSGLSASSISAALASGAHVTVVARSVSDTAGETTGNIAMAGVPLSAASKRDLTLTLAAQNNLGLVASSIDAQGSNTAITLAAENVALANSAVRTNGRIAVAADRLGFARILGAATGLTSGASGDAIVVQGRSGDGLAVFANNAGSSVFNTANGRWLVYARNPVAEDLSDLRSLPYAFTQHGASFAERVIAGGNIVTPAPGNGLLYAAAPNTVTFDGSTTKTYDGDAFGTIARSAIRVTGGLLPGERALIGDSVAGTYDSRNTDARTFTPQGSAVRFIDAQGRPVFGYDNNLGALQGRITPAPLTLLGAAAADKNYDATTAARITSLSLGGLVGDEQLGFVASGAFDDANAAVGKTVRGNVAALSDGANGGQARNYTLRGGGFTTTATITPAPLTVNATATAADKTYDATTAATITSFQVNGLLGSEQVGLVASGAFDDPNAGVGKTVRGSISGLSNGANGGLSSNYTLRDPSFTTTATITPAALTVLAASAADKNYDATTAAQITSVSFAGLVGSEQVGFVASGAFDDANAAVGKTVRGNVSALGNGANGGLASNYSVRGASFTTSATIAPAPVTVIATAADKTYDATTAATITSFRVNGLVDSEQLGLAAASGAFDDANAGVGKTVRGSVAGLSDGANGGLSGNYTLRDATFTTSATISPAELTVQAATAADKTYDTSTAAQITSVSLRGLIGSEQLGVAATGAFADANADRGKTVRGNVTALSNGSNGGLANNYTLRDGAFTTTATIEPATLTYRADGTTWNLPTITPLTGSVTGLVGGDTLAGATTGTLSFTAPAAAATAPGTFAVQGGGLAARNYVFVQDVANVEALSVNRRIVDSIVVERVAPFVGNELFPLPPIQPIPAPGRTTDVSPWIGTSAFDSVLVGGMSQQSLSSMLSARERYKARVFAEALNQLEREPTLADSPDCKTPQQVETGTCLITETLKREMAARSGVTQAEASPTAAPTPTPTPAPAPAAQEAARVAAAPVADPLASFAAKRRVKAATLPQIERKVAVLIGIDDYTDARIPKLANAAGDARAVAELLETKLGYETVVLANAGKAQIIRTLNTLAATLGAKDSIVVYYAGHGQLVSGTGLGYWQVGDADAADAKSWLSNADIGKLISRLGASQVVLVSDSCFSGSLVSDERIRPLASSADAGTLLSRRAAVVMSSGGNEPVFDAGKNGHSPFAFSLMQTLQGVPTWQAGGNVFERVRFAVARELPQRPRYGAAVAGGHEAGSDYVFERRELEKN